MKKTLALVLVLLGIQVVPAQVSCPGLLCDANVDGITNIGDIIFLMNYLWHGGPPPRPLLRGNCNHDGVR